MHREQFISELKTDSVNFRSDAWKSFLVEQSGKTQTGKKQYLVITWYT
jgi:hypothetical protein